MKRLGILIWALALASYSFGSVELPSGGITGLTGDVTTPVNSSGSTVATLVGFGGVPATSAAVNASLVLRDGSAGFKAGLVSLKTGSSNGVTIQNSSNANDAQIYEDTNNSLQFWLNGANRISLASAGGVTIGTSTVRGLLTLEDSTSTQPVLMLRTGQNYNPFRIFNTGGATLFDINTAGSIVTTPSVATSNGSAGSPNFTENSLFRSGMYLPSSDVVAFSTHGVERARFLDNPGNLAIGTTSASQMLTIGTAGQFQVTSTGAAVFNGATTGGVTVVPTASGASWNLALPGTTGTSGQFLKTDGTGITSWASGNSGTVTSVGLGSAGGIFSVGSTPVTTSGTITQAVAGTSGGIPYFSNSSTLTSSAALTANGVVLGGGAGATPVATATGAATTYLQGGGAGAPSFQALPTATAAAVGVVQGGTVPGINNAGTIGVGYIGESVIVTAGTNAAVAATTTYKTIASTTLTAGKWNCTGVAYLNHGDIVAMTRIIAAISTATNSTDSTTANNFSLHDTAGITAGDWSIPAGAGRIINVNSSTPVYLVGRADYTSQSTATWDTGSDIQCIRL